MNRKGLPEDALTDLKDTDTCARVYLKLKRCQGGRIISNDSVCPHCGSDKPEKQCLQPSDFFCKEDIV